MRIVRRIAWIFAVVGTAALMVMMVLITADVTSRSLGRGFSGTIEFSECLMIVATFLALGWTQVLKQHISIDFFYRRFSPRMKSVVRIFDLLFAIGFCLVLFFASGLKALDSFVGNEYVFAGSGFIKLWPFRITLFVGVGLLCAALFSDLCSEIGSYLKDRRH